MSRTNGHPPASADTLITYDSEPRRDSSGSASDRSIPLENLVDAAVLAGLLGVSRGFVYEHAGELGAVKLGAGTRPRLRFNPQVALDRLNSCSTGRESQALETQVNATVTRRRRTRSKGQRVELLPIRGAIVPKERAA